MNGSRQNFSHPSLSVESLVDPEGAEGIRRRQVVIAVPRQARNRVRTGFDTNHKTQGQQ